jgi:hypothetical protein
LLTTAFHGILALVTTQRRDPILRVSDAARALDVTPGAVSIAIMRGSIRRENGGVPVSEVLRYAARRGMDVKAVARRIEPIVGGNLDWASLGLILLGSLGLGFLLKYLMGKGGE